MKNVPIKSENSKNVRLRRALKSRKHNEFKYFIKYFGKIDQVYVENALKSVQNLNFLLYIFGQYIKSIIVHFILVS